MPTIFSKASTIQIIALERSFIQSYRIIGSIVSGQRHHTSHRFHTNTFQRRKISPNRVPNDDMVSFPYRMAMNYIRYIETVRMEQGLVFTSTQFKN